MKNIYFALILGAFSIILGVTWLIDHYKGLTDISAYGWGCIGLAVAAVLLGIFGKDKTDTKTYGKD